MNIIDENINLKKELEKEVLRVRRIKEELKVISKELNRVIKYEFIRGDIHGKEGL